MESYSGSGPQLHKYNNRIIVYLEMGSLILNVLSFEVRGDFENDASSILELLTTH
jgi:hypothetical protein